MMIAGHSFGSSALASITNQSNAAVDPWNEFPITVLHNNIHVRDRVRPNSASIDDTQGEQKTASLTFVNPINAPVAGDLIEVRYFDYVLFSGTLDRINRTINVPLTLNLYECQATDWTQVLVRRNVNRRFTDLPIPTLVASLLDNELSDEGFTFGSTDYQTEMELVDAQNISAFDLLRDVAGVSGQILEIDTDKTIYFRATSNLPSPVALTDSVIESVSLIEDRENYRNVQTVVVTGTPSSSSEDEQELTVVEENTEQIAARAAIEGGSGRYERLDEIRHPISNAQPSLANLAQTYADLLLAINGTMRKTLSVRTRGYGWRSGQVDAATSLTSVAVVGSWFVQRVATTIEDGRRLVHELELVESSLQQRVYESWASIIGKGKAIISIATAALGTQSISFTTPGSHQWVSTVTGTITITTMGGSGGGGGATPGSPFRGGRGGNSGKTVSSVTVVSGDTLDIVVGAKGLGGAIFTDGTAGTATTVVRGSTTLSMAGGGGGGDGNSTGANGAAGGGSDGVVTTGGGKTGGAGGVNTGPTSGSNGQDGSVTIEY